jgi:hypothetical protein
MGKVNMKGATPQGWVSLCGTCAWAHVVAGYRESEMVVVCRYVEPNVPVAFKVRECSGYLDKNRPSYNQMQRLAIDVLPASSAKRVGFKIGVAPAVCEDDEEDDE